MRIYCGLVVKPTINKLPNINLNQKINKDMTKETLTHEKVGTPEITNFKEALKVAKELSKETGDLHAVSGKGSCHDIIVIRVPVNDPARRPGGRIELEKLL